MNDGLWLFHLLRRLKKRCWCRAKCEQGGDGYRSSPQTIRHTHFLYGRKDSDSKQGSCIPASASKTVSKNSVNKLSLLLLSSLTTSLVFLFIHTYDEMRDVSMYRYEIKVREQQEKIRNERKSQVRCYILFFFYSTSSSSKYSSYIVDCWYFAETGWDWSSFRKDKNIQL